MTTYLHRHASEIRKASLTIAAELVNADTESRAAEAASVLAEIVSALAGSWSKAEEVYGASNLVASLRRIARQNVWSDVGWANLASACGRRARKILLDAPDHALRWLGSA